MHGALAEPYTITAVENHLDVTTAAGYPPLHLKIYGRRASFALDSSLLKNIHYRAEAERAMPTDAGDLWSPGYFSLDLSTETSATLVASTEAWDLIEALNPEDAAAAESERREHLLAGAEPAARSGWGRNSCSPPISSSSRPRAARRRGPRARRGRRCPHRDRRLPLVHGLGPRHDDQPGRA